MLTRSQIKQKPNTAAPRADASKKMKVLVVDDHPIMREGMARVLEQESDLTVCGQAGNIPQALEQIESSKPDLVVVDISLGGENGLNLINEIKVRYRELPVLVHSMHDESVYAERALQAGANGYLMKHEPPHQLLQALRQVLRGDIYVSPSTAKRIVRRLAVVHQADGTSPLQALTEREFEVFKLIGQGQSTRQLAETLRMSPKTVHVHRDHMKRKLSLKDGASLVHFAVQWAESRV